jgi:hypothetical protein
MDLRSKAEPLGDPHHDPSFDRRDFWRAAVLALLAVLGVALVAAILVFLTL